MRRRLLARLRAVTSDDGGASPVEFVLVGTLLTVLTLGVLQLGLTIYVRNVLHDAAVEGAYHAALADTSLTEGALRTSRIVTRAVGAAYASDVVAHERARSGGPVIEVTVRAPFPLIGLLGMPRMLEVTAHAPIESFD
ncbi:TadE/TadG family type IV pilus assembly protein [Microbacterium sp. NPDC019599]|uniref:TadE/TadG family type IV pilus assembly protein n=1 Tax=Microbacterium sp. NPDC019599 TaxID=3154690 RepID=UPI0033CFF45D